MSETEKLRAARDEAYKIYSCYSEHRDLILKTLDDALREKLEREEPRALTLEELRALHENAFLGAAVKIAHVGKESIGLANAVTDLEENGEIVAVFGKGTFAYKEKDYGKTWIAYRYEPKGAPQ